MPPNACTINRITFEAHPSSFRQMFQFITKNYNNKISIPLFLDDVEVKYISRQQGINPKPNVSHQ